MNQFSERYKTFSNTDLLRIIENEKDYDPEAFKAAQLEISQRQLTEDELNEAAKALEDERQKVLRQRDKQAEIESKLKSMGALIFEAINPIQKSAPTPERLIRLITMVFGIIAIYRWYIEFDSLLFMITGSNAEWDVTVGLFFVPLFLLPIAIGLFWFRKKWGWLLMAAYITFSICVIILTIVMGIMYSTKYPEIDLVFPQPSPVAQLASLVFFSGVLWILVKRDLREHFGIDQQSTIATVAIVAVGTLCFFIPYLFTGA